MCSLRINQYVRTLLIACVMKSSSGGLVEEETSKSGLLCDDKTHYDHMLSDGRVITGKTL